MSTRKGAGSTRRRAPAHQNSFAFKHNKNSKKTLKIQGIQHGHLCTRCQEQIEWRKKYRKYKPLKAPKKCRGCEKKSVVRAYHVLCNSCAGGRGVCAKCLKSHADEENGEGNDNEENRGRLAQLGDVEPLLTGMKEREKRSILRKVERGEMILEKLEDGSFELREVQEESEEEDAESEEDAAEGTNETQTEKPKSKEALEGEKCVEGEDGETGSSSSVTGTDA